MREPPCLVPSFQSPVGPRTCCTGAVPANQRPTPLLARPSLPPGIMPPAADLKTRVALSRSTLPPLQGEIWPRGALI